MAIFHIHLLLLLLGPLLHAAAAAVPHRYSPSSATANHACQRLATFTFTDLQDEPKVSAAGLVTSDSPTVTVFPPPPPILGTWTFDSKLPPQSERSASAFAASTIVNDPEAAVTTLHPLTNPVAWMPASDHEEGQRQIEMVLTSLVLWWNGMLAAAPLLTNSRPLARSPEEAIVFAPLGDFLQHLYPCYERTTTAMKLPRGCIVLVSDLGSSVIAHHDRDCCFLPLAVRVEFVEQFANLTAFALDGEAIFVGSGMLLLCGGQDYVLASRFQLVSHNLCCADLLPAMEDGGEILDVTPRTGFERADVFIDSDASIDRIYAQFPLLYGWVDDAAQDAKTGGPSAILWAVGLLPVFLIPLGNYIFARRTLAAYVELEINGTLRTYHVCDNCRVKPVNWVASCCQLCLCCRCFADVFLRRHSSDICDHPCQAPGAVGEQVEYRKIIFEKNRNYYQSSVIELDAEQVPYRSADPVAMLRLEVFTHWRDLYARHSPQRTVKISILEHSGRIRRWSKVFLAPKKYTCTKITLVMRWIGWD